MGTAEGTVEWIDRDLEARKHLWQGLQRLDPADRVAFLRHACTLVPKGGVGAGMKVLSHTGTVQEAYYDIIYASATHGLNLSRACAALEQWLRKVR